MRVMLSMIQLIEEINQIFPLENIKSKIYCTVYEDNESYIAMVQNSKFNFITKQIAIKYHHVRKHINKTIMINSVDTREQTADIFTKLLEVGFF